jgi:hypothetical protein
LAVGAIGRVSPVLLGRKTANGPAFFDKHASYREGEGDDPMSIRCVCQNGHVLNVKESQAGKTGLCPKCRTPVAVPKPTVGTMTEDTILGILGDRPGSPHRDTSVNFGSFSDTSLSGIHKALEPKKICERCQKEVALGTHICPYCHTYIANLRDF